MKNLYIGLMSGTSMDAVDAALVDFTSSPPKLIASYSLPIPLTLKQQLNQLCEPSENEIYRMGEADVAVGELFAKAVVQLLKQADIHSEQIKAIGSHGQTIRHHPEERFTLQIGDPNIIASRTGTAVVADFRRKDIALGGQGAPLTPAFHAAVFNSDAKSRIVLNIGGIANVTYLPVDHDAIIGFDTGPGNTLLDVWCNEHLNQSLDVDGQWAARGKVIEPLLARMLQDTYFSRLAPKSTGREYFNLSWLKSFVDSQYDPQDVQATLVELTAQSIAKAVQSFLKIGEVLVCGGGVHNCYLLQRLGNALPGWSIVPTTNFGLDVDWVEAMAFAWFAKQAIDQNTSNVPSVTGAKSPVILGGIYYP